MRILGIETSCDETAAAVVEDGSRILSNVVASQFDLHGPFGGVVPELAARAHAERITAIVEEALRRADCTREQIGAISVVHSPGLIGALLVGLSAAKALAVAWQKPLLAVDHIAGHVYASVLAGFQRFPHIALIVSGGHTSLYRVSSPLDYTVLGQTTDDAAGEAFDKVAKMLELGFPGGPALARCAQAGRPDPRLFRGIGRGENNPETARPAGLDFSFSGLKTAVYYHLRGTTRGRGPLRPLTEQQRADVAASFQEAACQIMVSRTLAACRREKIAAAAFGGGVACNQRLRQMFAQEAARETPAVEVFFPPPVLCADNAAMTAGLGYHKLLAGQLAPLDVDADPTPQRSEAATKR